MRLALDIALWLAAAPVALASGYLLVLVLASARRAPPAARPPRLRFDVIIPAHDEEAGIAATVASALATDWPAAARRVLVVADNCTDATAARAREAGALVLERRDPERRGKGYALALAFDRSLRDGVADAVVVIDADTAVTPNLLAAFAARLEAGAVAAQSDNGVRNPGDSWRTALMALAFVLFNTLRSLGRDRLGLSAGLRGNGMCLSTALLRRVPHHAVSEVEDLEYGIRLGLEGHRVRFAHEARVLSDMVSTAAASGSQRRRWEGGRRRMARLHAGPLLRAGVRRADPVLLDLALDLLVPPLALLGTAAMVGLGAALGVGALVGALPTATWAFALALASLGAYLVRGLVLSGLGWRGVTAVLHVPLYLAWKVGLAVGRRGGARPGEWVRTQRERRE
jgi:cellulose synthase/poly-beta-1,6-N-acetylglucosamine synthase-like glycosyltransferase